jgi:hypothetical protein
VEDKSAMTSELPPNEVVPDVEEVIPEVKKETIVTTEAQKVCSKYPQK